jgi:uncharacterized protein DUF6962
VTLLEPDVALTDLGLAIECAVLAAWLHWRAPAGRPLRTWFVVFFAALGIGALLGGIAHGFLPDIRSTIYGIVWSATLLAIGIAALASWAIGARLLFSERAAKRVLVLAGLLFIVYVATVLLLSQSFAVAIAYYVPAAAFLLIAFVVTHLRRPRNYLVAGIAGLVLSFAAAAIQQTEVGMLGLSHNALYHLVQAAALLLIFAAARGLTREATCRHDATS